MTAVFRLGDDVRLPDGSEGQVWLVGDPDDEEEPRPADLLTVATDDGFSEVSAHDVELIHRQIEPERVDMAAKRVRANKAHECSSDVHGDRPPIRPGQMYVRAVAFPGHFSLPDDATEPVVLKLCERCAAAYDNTHPNTLPPRSKK